MLGTLPGTRDSGARKKTLAALSDVAPSGDTDRGRTTNDAPCGYSCATALRDKNGAL